MRIGSEIFMNTTAVVTSILSLGILAATANSALAGTDAVGTTSPQVVPSPTAAENLLPISSGTVPINQSAGVIQNNGFGGFSYPACAGLCAFGIVKTSVTGNSPSAEAMVGIIWQIDSPEKTNAQAILRQAQTQQDALEQQTVTTLSEKLAEAIEKNLPERVNIIAIILAKKLGYSNHHQFLADVYNISTTHSAHQPPSSVNTASAPKSTIDVPINY